MNIGEVRQALRVLESETAAEQGRRKGYLNTYQDMKRKLYLYLILTGIVGAIWGLIHIVCVQSEKIFQSELLLMKYHVERERLLKIRADLAKEGIYGHSGMCYNEGSRNEGKRQPDGEPDSILMTMEESK